MSSVPPPLPPHQNQPPPAYPSSQPPQGYPPQGYAPQPLGYAVPSDGVVCPRCGQYGAKAVTFSWWGGLLGPKLLNHTKCPSCGFTFNRKTGRSNNMAIAIYTIVAIGLCLAIGIALAVFR